MAVNFNAGAIYPQLDLQQPDILGSYLRGAMAPGALAAQQQGLAEGAQRLQMGGLQLSQLQLAMQRYRAVNDIMQSAFQGDGQTGAGAPSVGVSSRNGAEAQPASAAGGIQTGPQAKTYGSASDDTPNLAVGISRGLYGYSDPMGRLSSPQITALGVGAPEVLKGFQEAREAALTKAQQAALMDNTNPMGYPMLKELAGNQNADQVVKNNASYRAAWPTLALQAGVDGRLLYGNDQGAAANAVRQVAAQLANRVALPLKLPAVAPPEHFHQIPAGFGGSANVNDTTGQVTPALPREMPVKVGESYDPVSGHNIAQYHSFLGGGSGTGNGDIRVDTGMGPPTNEQYDAARNAQLMVTADQRMGQLERSQVNGKPFDLTPNDRTLILQALTKEDTSNFDQLILQEGLRHGLSPQGQQYMTAMTPFLIAAGHNWGQNGIGRLTPTMARQTFETFAPIDASDPKIISMIQQNRQQMIESVLSKTGNARNSPMYQSLGPIYDNIAKGNAAPPTNAHGWKLHRDANYNYAYVSPDGKQVQELK